MCCSASPQFHPLIACPSCCVPCRRVARHVAQNQTGASPSASAPGRTSKRSKLGLSEDDTAAAAKVGAWLGASARVAGWYERLLLLDAVDVRELHGSLKEESLRSAAAGRSELPKCSLKQLEAFMQVQGLVRDSCSRLPPPPHAR